MGDRVGPGVRWLDKEFEGELLAFGSKAHVRLVGPEAQDILDEAIPQSVDAVLFTERSRTGVLVRLPNRASFGLDSERLRILSDDIAVLCYTRD